MDMFANFIVEIMAKNPSPSSKVFSASDRNTNKNSGIYKDMIVVFERLSDTTIGVNRLWFAFEDDNGPCCDQINYASSNPNDMVFDFVAKNFVHSVLLDDESSGDKTTVETVLKKYYIGYDTRDSFDYRQMLRENENRRLERYKMFVNMGVSKLLSRQ
jgi:hypothetical protein